MLCARAASAMDNAFMSIRFCDQLQLKSFSFESEVAAVEVAAITTCMSQPRTLAHQSTTPTTITGTVQGSLTQRKLSR